MTPVTKQLSYAPRANLYKFQHIFCHQRLNISSCQWHRVTIIDDEEICHYPSRRAHAAGIPNITTNSPSACFSLAIQTHDTQRGPVAHRRDLRTRLQRRVALRLDLRPLGYRVNHLAPIRPSGILAFVAVGRRRRRGDAATAAALVEKVAQLVAQKAHSQQNERFHSCSRTRRTTTEWKNLSQLVNYTIIER